MKKIIQCPCGNNLSAEYDEELDLDKKPEELNAILNGSFLSFKCSSCDKEHKPEYKIKIIWKSKDLVLEVLPELDRGSFYRKKETVKHQTVIGYPEMQERLAVIKDDLNPVVIETLKSYLYAKAEDNYPDTDINIYYYCKADSGIEFHVTGIRKDEVAVMRVPQDLYDKTLENYKKHPKNELFTSLQVRSYMSVQNILRHELLK